MAKKAIKKSEIIEEKSYRKLVAEELRWTCPTDIFKFKTTAEVGELEEIVGQPRAVEAIKLGAKINAKGFNIFVSGLTGTGRLSTVKKILAQTEGYSEKFFDYCYVNNFKEPEKPLLLKLKSGEGKKFSKAMDNSISYLRRRIPKLFEEEDFLLVKRKLVEQFHEKENEILLNFDEKIKPFNFIRGQYENPQGQVIPDVFPVIDGKPVHIDTLDQLVSEGKIKSAEADKIRKNYLIFHQEIFNLSRIGVQLLQEFRKNEAALDRATSEIIINAAFRDIEENYSEKKVHKYISSVKEYISDNLGLFLKQNEPITPEQEEEEQIPESEKFLIFKVNVVLDNSGAQKHPIVIETTPSYSNLFGTIEKIYDKRQGTWKTDFTKIKAGSLLKADQGYLVIDAEDMFAEDGVWQSLKRVLIHGKLEMQPSEAFYQMSQSSIKPESIDLTVKIILIGSYQLYYLLNAQEKSFSKIFRINAPFDYVTSRNTELIENYAKFVSTICNESNIPHLTPDGMAALVEVAAELSGCQNRMTLQFSQLSNLVIESSYYAGGKRKPINRQSIEKALEMRRFRNNLFEEKSNEVILNNKTIIKNDGYAVGEMNGLVIMTLGDYEYGEPSRITATVSVGHAGITNIEREAAMSGRLHNKAVLIISGFLRERFAQKFPLSISASIAFEQAYDGIDGDSASLAEIYVLMSAISGVPINQSLAITGSMSQKGDVQPIGGVNDKIRGYWGICSKRGFNGKQGVIIPVQNVCDLMLSKELINDVKNEKFAIYSMKSIEDAIPLLFGMPAGEPGANGIYPEDTLFGKVHKRLEELYKLSRPKREETHKHDKQTSMNKSKKA
jgi:lon-related putative ATP-dependent protease